MNYTTLVENEVRDELIFPVLGKGQTYVEIGVFVGGNILRVHDFSISNNLNLSITGIDNFRFDNISPESFKWAGVDSSENFESYVRRNLEHTNISLINSYSEKAVLSFENESIDILFIDGDHDYTAVLNELVQWIPKVKDGGYIIGHDWPCSGVKQAVKETFFQTPLISSTGGGYRIQVL